jgi:anti-sigma B factor antagonist
MKLDLRVRHHDDWAVVFVGGEVDLATCPQLRDALAELVDQEVYHLIVDLEGVSFLDSSGIGVLVSVLRRTRDHGGSLRLTAPGPQVRRVLELTGVTKLLTTYATLDEAMPVEPLEQLASGDVNVE